MEKIIHEYLTLQEELLVSVYYLNVEKFKYLISLKEFKQEYLYTSTADVKDNTFHLYCINQAYRYICQLDEFKLFKAKNDAMLQIWDYLFDLPIENDQILINCYVHKNGPDYAGDVAQFKDLDTHIHLVKDLEFWRHAINHLGKEEAPLQTAYDLDYLVRLAMLARMKDMVDKENFHAGVDLNELIARIEEKEFEDSLNIEKLPDEVKSFIDSHDKPEEIIALYDEGKFTRRMGFPVNSLCEYLCRTKYLKIRVGGNSFRIGDTLKEIAKKYGVESKIEDMDHFVRCHHFEWDEPLIQYADKFDFRGQGSNDKMYSMVWFYVNNVTCGWYEEDGTFCNIDTNRKGAWQIAEVIKAKGYKELPPATCAITCGRDERISGRQETMCREEGIDFLNIYNMKSYANLTI